MNLTLKIFSLIILISSFSTLSHAEETCDINAPIKDWQGNRFSTFPCDLKKHITERFCKWTGKTQSGWEKAGIDKSGCLVPVHVWVPRMGKPSVKSTVLAFKQTPETINDEIHFMMLNPTIGKILWTAQGQADPNSDTWQFLNDHLFFLRYYYTKGAYYAGDYYRSFYDPASNVGQGNNPFTEAANTVNLAKISIYSIWAFDRVFAKSESIRNKLAHENIKAAVELMRAFRFPMTTTPRGLRGAVYKRCKKDDGTEIGCYGIMARAMSGNPGHVNFTPNLTFGALRDLMGLYFEIDRHTMEGFTWPSNAAITPAGLKKEIFGIVQFVMNQLAYGPAWSASNPYNMPGLEHYGIAVQKGAMKFNIAKYSINSDGSSKTGPGTTICTYHFHTLNMIGDVLSNLEKPHPHNKSLKNPFAEDKMLREAKEKLIRYKDSRGNVEAMGAAGSRNLVYQWYLTAKSPAALQAYGCQEGLKLYDHVNAFWDSKFP